MRNRSILPALAAGVAGLLLGHALPRAAPVPGAVGRVTSASPAPAPAGCRAERAELSSTRAQLAICLAYRASPEPEPEPEPEATPPAGARTSGAAATPAAPPSPEHPDHARVRALLAAEPSRHVEHVIVRHRDGTVRGYRPEDWPADRDDGQIIARESPGRVGYYALDAGLDAGPVALHDLAGPDGVVRMGGMRFVFPKSDTEAP